jgi:N-acetylglucosaminyldiphosphoundecaprenol N-acetyl-beta-D-mannosaminyltransferase
MPRDAPSPRPRPEVLGVPLDPMTLEGAVDRVLALVDQEAGGYVCVRDVHGVILCQDDAELLTIHREAAMVTMDGMPLVWRARRRGFPSAERVYGPDLMAAVCGRRVGDLRHFLFGSTPAVLVELQANLERRFPSVRIVGAHSPPFGSPTPDQTAEAHRRIVASRADVVWVGLSTPKQERWMASSSAALNPAVLIGVGAAFDFLAGGKPQAPAWMQRAGLEWLFRMSTEPVRLGPRYLKVIPRYLWLTIREALRSGFAASSATDAGTQR